MGLLLLAAQAGLAERPFDRSKDRIELRQLNHLCGQAHLNVIRNVIFSWVVALPLAALSAVITYQMFKIGSF